MRHAGEQQSAFTTQHAKRSVFRSFQTAVARFIASRLFDARFTYESARDVFVSDNESGSHSVMYAVRILGLGARPSVLRPVFCGSEADAVTAAIGAAFAPGEAYGRRPPEIHL